MGSDSSEVQSNVIYLLRPVVILAVLPCDPDSGVAPVHRVGVPVHAGGGFDLLLLLLRAVLGWCDGRGGFEVGR